MKFLTFLAAIVLAGASFAVEPSEVLDDPILEERARSISQSLRCLQCRNESIDESNADIAQTLRVLVRDRLLAGDTDTEVVDFVVTRYGEYVLLRPNGRGANLVLWLAGPVLFLVTVLGLWLVAKAAKPRSDGVPLTPQEEAALQELLARGDEKGPERHEV